VWLRRQSRISRCLVERRYYRWCFYGAQRAINSFFNHCQNKNPDFLDCQSGGFLVKWKRKNRCGQCSDAEVRANVVVGVEDWGEARWVISFKGSV
jgi:hypothetical protein